jgi:predicted helicase
MTQIYHANLYGIRNSKYDWLQNHDVLSTEWQEIHSQTPFYLLIPQNTDLWSEYEQGWKITEVMPVNSVGIVTARDNLTIHWTEDEAWATVQDFASLDSEVAREKYNLGKDARDWKVTLAQDDLKRSGVSKQNLVPIFYRPFDIRYTYYTGNSRGFHCRPRNEVMRNLANLENLSLITSRLTKGETFQHTQVAQGIAEVICMSPKTSNNGFVFPLYLYSNGTTITQQNRANFSSQFLKSLTVKLGKLPAHEVIFYYIYAALHSPTYRTRYAEFLKIDFPRIPLTSNPDLFQTLATLGEQLVSLHLMRSPLLDTPITQFEQHHDRTVAPAHPKYNNGAVHINKQGDRFTGVPEEVWNFHIGGYQVCEKWLKDRKGRTLSDGDIQHYQRIVVALKETIRLMAEIDAAIPSWPIE